MSTPRDVDYVLDALATTLQPGGVPVGTLAAVYARTPTPPYQGALPALFLRGLDTERTRLAARAKILDGTIEAVYIAATPEQSALTLPQIEDAMYATIGAVGAAIDADPHLGQSVASCGETISVRYDPEAPYREYAGGLWVSATLRISFRGAKFSA